MKESTRNGINNKPKKRTRSYQVKNLMLKARKQYNTGFVMLNC